MSLGKTSQSHELRKYLHGDGGDPVGLRESRDVVLDVPVEEASRAAPLDLGVGNDIITDWYSTIEGHFKSECRTDLCMDTAHRRHGGHEGHGDSQVGRLLVQGGGQVDGARVVDVVLISEVLELVWNMTFQSIQ